MAQVSKGDNYAFIDSQNLNLAIKGLDWQLDFKRFRIYLKDKFSVSKAFLFIGYMAGNESLYTYLQSSGYVLVFKPILEIKGKVKGNVDAELVLHAMIEYGNYDKAVIVSGDGDFHCLVEYLISQDKLANLIIPNKYKYSSLLRKFVNENVMWFLNKERQKLEHKKREA